MSESVILSFIDLYEKGLIYRGFRMVNWDPKAKTTLSDEEVIYEERKGNLYFIKYIQVLIFRNLSYTYIYTYI